MKSKFVEIPGKRLKKQKGRFGGDQRRHDGESLEADLSNRQTRRSNKRQLQRAMADGEFDLPASS